jgi:hypothetical protein
MCGLGWRRTGKHQNGIRNGGDVADSGFQHAPAASVDALLYPLLRKPALEAVGKEADGSRRKLTRRGAGPGRRRRLSEGDRGQPVQKKNSASAEGLRRIPPLSTRKRRL